VGRVSQVVTGEAVALELSPAALPSRLLAAIVDGALLATAFVAMGALAAASSIDLSPAGAAALAVVAVVSVFVALPIAVETLWRGRTPGKAALGLRVVRDDGGPIGFRHAFVRGLVGFVVEKPGISVGSVAVIASLAHPQGKRLGDLLAGTIVLQERVAGARGVVTAMPPALAPWAATLDLSGLSPQLLLSVRQYLARAGQMTEAARATLGQQLLDAVLARTSPPPPAGAPGWAVLSAVLAERRRREEERAPGWLPPTATPAATPAAPPAASPGPAVLPPAPAPAPVSPPEPGPGGFALPQ
jgi:uncharacterized RDD family membrane protein YckC